MLVGLMVLLNAQPVLAQQDTGGQPAAGSVSESGSVTDSAQEDPSAVTQATEAEAAAYPSAAELTVPDAAQAEDGETSAEDTGAVSGPVDDTAAQPEEVTLLPDAEMQTAEEEAFEAAAAAGAISYIYVDCPELPAPGEQNIAVAFTDEELVLSDAVLVFTDASGRVSEESADMLVGNPCLFTFAYGDDAPHADYTLPGIRYASETGAEMTEVSFADEQMEGGFSVLSQAEANTEEPLITAYAVDENGNMTETSGDDASVVTEALEEAVDTARKEQAAVPAEDGFAALENAEMTTQATGLVVAIDPGHDSTHGGANNKDKGLYEEVMTLKLGNYLKTELEKYQGVRVVMTRTGAACPYPGCGTSGNDIAKRVAAAKSRGAQVYVSLHFNNANKDTANGAEVIVQNNSYDAAVAATSQKLGKKILAQLVALGLNNRGTYSKDDTTGETDENGVTMDFFAVHYNCKLKHIPGIIIEHAFLSGSSDSTWIGTDAGLKKLALADAKGIAATYGLVLKTGGSSEPEPLDLSKAALTIENFNEAAGTWTVRISGLPAIGVSKVQLPVWCDGDQNDIVWYTAVKQSNGTYTVDVRVSNHKYHFGKYKMHCYVTDIYGLRAFAAKCTKTVSGVTPVVTSVLDSTQKTASLNVTGVALPSGVKRVQFAVWSVTDGQDDLKWYTAVKNGDAYTYTCSVSAHRTLGKYNVHVYALDGAGQNVFVGKSTFTVSKPSMDSIGFSSVDYKAGMMNIDLKGVRSPSGITKVQVPVWSSFNGQDDIVWYTASRISDGTYRVPFSVSRHNDEMGEYVMHVYVTDGNGIRTFVKGKTHLMNDGTVKVMAIPNSNETVMSLQAQNMSLPGGIKEFRFAVWSRTNGQDDLRWYTGKEFTTGIYKASCVISNHKTTGIYDVHGYAVDKDGKLQFMKKTTFTVAPPTMDSLSFTTDSASNQFTITMKGITAPSGINKVQVPVWTVRNGQDDIIWYTAARKSNGDYTLTVKTSAHNNESGWYNVHVYATDNNGVRLCVGKKSVSVSTTVLTPIMGASQCTVAQMVAAYQASGKTYPSAALTKGGCKNITAFCQTIYNEANAEGVRAEVVFAQAMVETGYLQFGGDVKVSQFNFAGLGATGNGNPGNSYASVAIGIRAQVQHLKAYGSTAALNQGCVDTRFSYVTRGCAPYVEWLGIQENPNGYGWASGAGYGGKITSIMNKVLSY